MRAGNKVKLVSRVCVYKPNSEGIIDSTPNESTVNVSINKDSFGKKVSPPDPLPPISNAKVEVIG